MDHYIDTHIHLNQLVDPAQQLREAIQIGVAAWIVPGVAPQNWPEVMAAAKLHEQVFVAPGVHPQAAGQHQKAHVDSLRRLLASEKAVAIGEVGLDRQLDVPWQKQEEVFIEMIRLARETHKPLLIHARRSTERVLELLQKEGAGQTTGIFHAFSGSLESARKVIDSGFLLGIGGVATFRTARRLPEVIRKVPAEALVLETDAPDMAPEPHRGEVNQPAYLALIAGQVAKLRDWSLTETAQHTTANACRVLGLPLPEEKEEPPDESQQSF